MICWPSSGSTWVTVFMEEREREVALRLTTVVITIKNRPIIPHSPYTQKEQFIINQQMIILLSLLLLPSLPSQFIVIGCCYYYFMEINLKIKFDKHNKTNTWDRPEQPFFIDHPPPKRTHYSPKSYRDQLRHPSIDHPQKSLGPPSARKASTARKDSATKQKMDKKSTVVAPTMHKNGSEKLKKTKKKIGAEREHSQLMDYQHLRGSLPGLPGKKVLQRFQPILSENQRIQLINEKTVYYVGIGSGVGEDDLEGRYLWKKHEQVGYRYELLQGLGRGAFGEVVKAFDHKTRQTVAVKIVRAGREHMQLALNEINILMKIKEQDIENRKNLLRIKDFIVFRKHICIITELLSTNLYQLLQANHFRPLNPHNIRAFAIQLLASLAFLKELGVIHSDLKPENVLMKHHSKVGIKIIDFGTSMFLNQANFLYIQSRFYRAPEVILGAKYHFPIDIWSLGCLLAELHLGCPLFAGENEQEQLSLIMRLVGPPSKEYLQGCKHTQKYFNKDFSPKIIKGKDGKAIIPSSKPLSSIIQDPNFCAFLQKILIIDPQARLTPLKALIDPWILAYFPQDIKKQHLNEILLKIKKEESAQEKKEGKTNTQKGHKKRHSDFHGGVATSHKRRGSQGMF